MCDAKLDAKGKAAMQLFLQWLEDESGYDEAVWPRVKQAIEENRLSQRPRFHEEEHAP